MTRWTVGLLAAGTLLAMLVVALLVWVIGLGQGGGGGEAGAVPPPGSARPRLDRYEWVDRDRGVVRIPIERAIDVVVGGEPRR